MPAAFKGEYIIKITGYTDAGGTGKGDGSKLGKPDIITSEELVGARDWRNKEKRCLQVLEERQPLPEAEEEGSALCLPSPGPLNSCHCLPSGNSARSLEGQAAPNLQQTNRRTRPGLEVTQAQDQHMLLEMWILVIVLFSLFNSMKCAMNSAYLGSASHPVQRLLKE